MEMSKDDVLNHIDGKLVGLLGFPIKKARDGQLAWAGLLPRVLRRLVSTRRPISST